eukprot:gnl/TRDRNA2_/TRDRNA2_84060_c0_seq1.p1 gnl/TRDRNA2_/TRDRNA2_84060_c0~~gnl/TRDRNA2_/TRDRNA2_84060_c0_seq1.p1  ORF type:complete len:539 (-),score=110.04 gnl/TRDRNA2_/TRDRNA2_84060_c0_seq1:90-1706(-)
MEQIRGGYDFMGPSMLRMIRSARTRQQREQRDVTTDGFVDGTSSAVVSEAGTKQPPSSARRRSEILPPALTTSLCIDRRQSIEGSAGTRAVSTRAMFNRRASGRYHSKAEQAAANQENAAPHAPTTSGLPQQPAGSALGDVTNFTGQTDQDGKTCEQVPCLSHGSTPAVPIVKPITTVAAPAEATTGSTLTSSPASPGSVEAADLARAEDPQYVTEYIPDIYRILQRDEASLLPTPGYMDKHAHLNAKMRAILVDWLVDVHKKYKLRTETLFQAIGLVDRFLELRQQTQRRQLQLVGVTALLIAAKFEELYPPQINDFVYVTDRAYTREEVIEMEVIMLSTLEFKVCRPNAAHFLERYAHVNGCTGAHRDLAQYLLELTLVDYKMIRYSPSHLAAGALLLSNKLLRRQPAWTPAAVKHTKLAEQMLKGCAREICALLEGAEASTLQAVRKKYSNPKYHSVAKLNFMSTVPTLAPGSSVPSGSRSPTSAANEEDDASRRRASTAGRSVALRRRSSVGGTTSEHTTTAASETVAPMDLGA